MLPILHFASDNQLQSSVGLDNQIGKLTASHRESSLESHCRRRSRHSGTATVPVSCGEPNVPLSMYKTRSCLCGRDSCKILLQDSRASQYMSSPKTPTTALELTLCYASLVPPYQALFLLCFERAWYAITRDPRHDLIGRGQCTDPSFDLQ